MMVHPTDATLTDAAVMCPWWSVRFTPCTYSPILPLQTFGRTCINDK